jgi:pimeloyl-ACP methyl ester carboxylesterase
MGVRSAVALAHLAPSIVAGLVLVDLGLAGPAGGGLGQPLADFLREMPMQFPSREAARTYLQTQCPDASIAQYLMAVATPGTPSVPQNPATPGSQPTSLTFPFDREALLKTLAAAENSSIRDWIPAILDYPIPILALRGETSRVWSAEEYEKEKARFAASPSLTFEVFHGTGHGLPFEKRAQFIERATQWIQAHS